MMIKQDMLDAYSEDEVKQVRDLAEKVLKRIDETRKSKAIEDARAMLAAAGLFFKDVAKAKNKPVKGPQYKGGHTYQHPTDKTLVWNTKGQKPKWLREVESKGMPPSSPWGNNYECDDFSRSRIRRNLVRQSGARAILLFTTKRRLTLADSEVSRAFNSHLWQLQCAVRPSAWLNPER